MDNQVNIEYINIVGAADELARLIWNNHGKGVLRAYPIPRGGVPAALAVKAACAELFPGELSINLVGSPEDADIFIDDLIDSGATKEKYQALNEDASFCALFDKSKNAELVGKWLVFPWEQTAEREMEDHVVRILEYIGEDPNRSGIQETPKRVLKALKEKTSGYGVDTGALLKTFEDGAEGVDEMVVVKDIPFHSMCEHHMENISGHASIAYIPNGKIVGLSKLARLLDAHAARLQVQERLTNAITKDLMEHLNPVGAACLITATHGCMECRGVKKQGSVTVTSSLKGVFKTQPETRAEFMAIANK
jgi:GTP cyclohydrolase I